MPACLLCHGQRVVNPGPDQIDLPPLHSSVLDLCIRLISKRVFFVLVSIWGRNRVFFWIALPFRAAFIGGLERGIMAVGFFVVVVVGGHGYFDMLFCSKRVVLGVLLRRGW